MGLIDNLKQRQQSSRRLIEVPEWAAEGEDPVTLYAGKFLAIDLDRIQRKHPGFVNNVTIGGMVDVIIMKAEDKDGSKMFTLEDKPTLMREPVEIITRIAGEMMTVTSSEEHEKN